MGVGVRQESRLMVRGKDVRADRAIFGCITV